MVTLTDRTRKIARGSLIAVWLGTAVISLPLDPHGQGEALLRSADVSTFWHGPLMLAGGCLDAALGLALWRWHRRSVYLLCGAALLLLTVIATLLLPDLWLDPLGRLLKNLPIAALLYLLHEDAPKT
ncbi:DoxX-like family protein [Burkholderiaceae bacterium UC74_6]